MFVPAVVVDRNYITLDLLDQISRSQKSPVTRFGGILSDFVGCWMKNRSSFGLIFHVLGSSGCSCVVVGRSLSSPSILIYSF